MRPSFDCGLFFRGELRLALFYARAGASVPYEYCRVPSRQISATDSREKALIHSRLRAIVGLLPENAHGNADSLGLTVPEIPAAMPTLPVQIKILAGLALSFGLNRFIARWIESGSRDPLIILAVSGLLMLVAALACLLPAGRALAVGPMTALRFE